MHFRSFDDLHADIDRWVRELPPDIELVVGIPRSGLLAANIIALRLNCHLTDVEHFTQGEYLASGRRCPSAPDLDDMENILVVDDSVRTGETIEEVKAVIDAEVGLSEKIRFGAVYVSDDGKSKVDTYAVELVSPRVFEWNMMHHPKLTEWCVDIDGVLCRDPLALENDDGARYVEFLTEVRPRVVPSYPIGHLVTSRLEIYRAVTEQWLADHSIEYSHLHMMDYPDMKTRRARGDYASYKASIYDATGAPLFIESNPDQARRICEIVKRPVFCTDTTQLYRPGFCHAAYGRTKSSVKRVRSKPEKYLTDFLTNPIAFAGKTKRHIVEKSKS